MKSIGHRTLNLPRHAPLMVLPGVHILFPSALLPLYIFEPRYRAMLDWSLEHDRMFGIAPMKPDITETRTTGEFHHILGLGLIRTSVQAADGTSKLVLKGLARMRVVGFVQESPFRIAELRELPSEPPSTAENHELTARLLNALTEDLASSPLEEVTMIDELKKITDAATLADVIAHMSLRDSEARQAVFEELNVARRSALLIAYLRAQESSHDDED